MLNAEWYLIKCTLGDGERPFREFSGIADVIAEFGSDARAHLIFDDAPTHQNVEEGAAIGKLSTEQLPK